MPANVRTNPPGYAVGAVHCAPFRALGGEGVFSVLVLLNPAAGAGRSARTWQRYAPLASRLFPDLQVQRTAGPGQAGQHIHAAAAAGVRHILLVGGDGTVHEALAAAVETGAALAVLPTGTGNDFARATRLLLPPSRLLLALAEGHERRVDLGTVHGQYFGLVAGAGFDAAVAQAINAAPRRGRGAGPYVGAVLRQAFAFAPADVTVEIDGQPVRAGPHLLVDVANAPAYGGGMRVCPPARIDDGLLHVFAVGDVRRWGTVAMLGRVLAGRHTRDRRVAILPARRVRVDGPAGMPLFADGEVLGGLPAEFAVRPGALRLWSPWPTA